jgi:hypothetical protein
MGQKGIPSVKSGDHYDRIQSMLHKFHLDNSEPVVGTEKRLGLFGPVDVGQGVCWWDYGQLKLYQRNALLLSEK